MSADEARPTTSYDVTRCHSHRPGHHLHWVQCRQSHQRGTWHTGVVGEASNHLLVVLRSEDLEWATFWNHRLLDGLLRPGDGVVWHDLHVLHGPRGVQLSIHPVVADEPLPRPCLVEVPLGQQD